MRPRHSFRISVFGKSLRECLLRERGRVMRATITLPFSTAPDLVRFVFRTCPPSLPTTHRSTTPLSILLPRATMSESDGEFSDELLELAGVGGKRKKTVSRPQAKRKKAEYATTHFLWLEVSDLPCVIDLNLKTTLRVKKKRRKFRIHILWKESTSIRKTESGEPLNS